MHSSGYLASLKVVVPLSSTLDFFLRDCPKYAQTDTFFCQYLKRKNDGICANFESVPEEQQAKSGEWLLQTMSSRGVDHVLHRLSNGLSPRRISSSALYIFSTTTP